MDFSYVIGVAGVLLTLVLGVWGVILTIRTRYPGRLTAAVEAEIPLFDTIVKSVPGLAVTFENEIVEPGLILFKFIVINDGVVDIQPNMVAESLSFTLSEGFSWRIATVAAASPKVEASIRTMGRELHLDVGLLRRAEYVRLEAIVDTPAPASETTAVGSKRLADAITIGHRIANTRPVHMYDIAGHLTAKRSLTFAKIVLLGGLFVLACGSIAVWRWGLPAEIQYQTIIGNEIVWVRAQGRADGTIHLKPVNGGSRRVVTLQQFSKLPHTAVRVAPDRFLKWMTVFVCLVYVTLPIIVILLHSVLRWRLSRIQKLIVPPPNGLTSRSS
jgi:hypothetical protein